MNSSERKPGTRAGEQIPIPASGDLSWLKPPSRDDVEAVDLVFRPKEGRFAIALDATGSMANLIAMAKRSTEEIIRRAMKRARRPLKILFIVYRDYDVLQSLIEESPLSDDAGRLTTWLGGITVHGGGSNEGEAVEAALERIRNHGAFDAVLLAGDEPPNSRGFLNSIGRQTTPTAQDLARKYAQDKTPIHTFVIGQRTSTVQGFAEIASLSGGQTGSLDGSDEMIDMAVMAMLSALQGSLAVKNYMQDYHLSSKSEIFGKLLLEAPKK